MARSIHTRRRLGEAVQVMHEGAWFLGVVRVVDPGKRSQYYCPRARAFFRHT